MTTTTVTGLRDRASTWADEVGVARDVVRRELARRRLVGHSPDGGRALDVGRGQGARAAIHDMGRRWARGA